MKTTPKTVPELRFSGFDGEWNRVKLANAIDSIDSGWSPQCSDKPAGLNEWGILKTTSVVWNGYNEGANKRLLPGSDPREQIEVKARDVLITRAGPSERVGVVAHVDRTRPMLMLSDKIIRLKCSDLADSRFIARCVSSKESQDHLLARKSGLAKSQTNISQNDLKSVPLTLPTLPEQRKIADFLTAVDGRIGQLSQKKALLEDYKKGVMQQLFTQALRFKDDHGNDFPEWKKKLGDVCEIVNGLTYTPEDVAPDGLLVLRSSNVQNGQIVFGDNVFVKVGVNEWNMSRPDDILICVRNGSKNLIGKNAIIPEGGPPSTHGAFMTVLRGEQNRFVFQLLQTDTYKRYVHINLGATINSINGSDLKKFKFGFPSLPEQTKIANFLAALDRKIESVSQQITHTQTFKKGLLQQMFV